MVVFGSPTTRRGRKLRDGSAGASGSGGGPGEECGRGGTSGGKFKGGAVSHRRVAIVWEQGQPLECAEGKAWGRVKGGRMRKFDGDYWGKDGLKIQQNNEGDPVRGLPMAEGRRKEMGRLIRVTCSKGWKEQGKKREKGKLGLVVLGLGNPVEITKWRVCGPENKGVHKLGLEEEDIRVHKYGLKSLVYLSRIVKVGEWPSSPISNPTKTLDSPITKVPFYLRSKTFQFHLLLHRLKSTQTQSLSQNPLTIYQTPTTSF